MPCLSETDIDLSLYSTQIRLFIEDFGLTYLDISNAFNFLKENFDETDIGSYEYEKLRASVNDYWNFHFSRYLINFAFFIKFCAYVNSDRIRLSPHCHLTI